MLTPQTLQKLPDDLIDLVSEVQTDIIKSIAKKLVKADILLPRQNGSCTKQAS